MAECIVVRATRSLKLTMAVFQSISIPARYRPVILALPLGRAAYTNSASVLSLQVRVAS